MSPKAYRVRNWKEYNGALVTRGSITYWFTKEAIAVWHEKKQSGQRGRPKKYSDVSIICGLTLKAVFHLPFRATEGLIKSVVEMLKLEVEAPTYSLLAKRQGQLTITLPKSGRQAGEGLHILVDSTGLKVYGEGEWKVRQHGWVKHRLWRKLHLGFNAQSQEIETFELTDLGTQDCEVVPALLDKLEGEVRSLTGDGAYDRFSVYEEAHQRDFHLITPPQRNSRTSEERRRSRNKASKEAVSRRDQVIKEAREWGRKEWKVQVGYHRRSLAETGMYRIKTLLGSTLKARKFAHQQVEAGIWCQIINKMTALGMPISIPVN